MSKRQNLRERLTAYLRKQVDSVLYASWELIQLGSEFESYEDYLTKVHARMAEKQKENA